MPIPVIDGTGDGSTTTHPRHLPRTAPEGRKHDESHDTQRCPGTGLRTNDHVEVRLLWNSLTDSVSISVHDAAYGESFEFDVAAAHALEAFRHPFAYAGSDHDSGHGRTSIYPPAGHEERTNDDQR